MEPQSQSSYNRAVIDGLKKAGVSFVASLPATKIHSIQKAITSDPYFTHVWVSNEGEGVAICGGAWLGGKPSGMLMEVSGFFVSIYSLTRLCSVFEIPILLMITYRGEVGDGNWWFLPWGRSLETILNSLEIPYLIIDKIDQIDDAISRARKTMDASKHPVAILLSGELAY